MVDGGAVVGAIVAAAVGATVVVGGSEEVKSVFDDAVAVSFAAVGGAICSVVAVVEDASEPVQAAIDNKATNPAIQNLQSPTESGRRRFASTSAPDVLGEVAQRRPSWNSLRRALLDDDTIDPGRVDGL